MKCVVADSSPLIALASSGHLHVLLALIHQVVIPKTVFLECTSDSDKPGAMPIRDAVVAGQLAMVLDPEIGIFATIDGVDIGEALAMALARKMKSPLLVDDAIARQVVKAHGIPVIGSCGILLAAKQRGLIPAVGPIVIAWKQELGYFLSDALVQEVLARAGEKPDAKH